MSHVDGDGSVLDSVDVPPWRALFKELRATDDVSLRRDRRRWGSVWFWFGRDQVFGKRMHFAQHGTLVLA
jgi:hypothetical protein